MKKQRRLVIESWLSALACLVMILGVSFAWFNTKTSVEADMIPIGEMKVEFLDSTGNAITSKKLQWQTKHTNYWEPGCTYYTEPFTVMNSGDLYFKYKLSVEGFTGDTELKDVISFHIYKYDTTNKKILTDKAYEGVEVSHKTLDAGATYVLCGTMSKNADNRYQGKKLGNVTVVMNATQIASGSTYSDVVLENGGEVDLSKATQVATFAELKNAAKAATAENPAVIVLTGDIEATGKVEIAAPVYIYSFTDSTISLNAESRMFDIKEEGSLYIEGVTMTTTKDTKNVLVMVRGALEMQDCQVTGFNTPKSALLEGRMGGNIVLTNSTFSGNTCTYMVRDYNDTSEPIDTSDDRAGTAYTKIQYCTFTENTSTWMFYIRSNYSVLGGNISGNTSTNAVFRLVNVKDALLDLRYVTLRNNAATGNQAAIAWVQSNATMNINEGTVMEGNTGSLSYGNIKAGAKSTLNINGGTIGAINNNGKGTETDTFTGLVNDNANVTISKDAVISGTHSGMDGYVSGTNWSKAAQ